MFKPHACSTPTPRPGQPRAQGWDIPSSALALTCGPLGRALPLTLPSPAALVPARLQAPSHPHAVCLVTRGWLSTQGSAHRCPAGPSQPLPGCPGFAGLQAKGSRFCLPSAGHEKLPCGRSPARRQTCAPCSASEHGVPARRPSPGRPAVRQALLSGLCMPELAPPARGRRPGSLPPGALPTRDKIVQWLRLQSPAAPVQSPAALPRSAGRPWAGNSLPQFPP